METNLRPLSLGEILDRTAQLYRSNFLVFAGIFSIYAGVALVLNLIQIGVGVLVDVVAVAVIVVYAARRHPVKDCPICHGRKSMPSMFIPWANGPCRACGGTGEHVRWTSRLIAPTTARQIRDRADKHRY